ncbi:MAG: glycosyltransferase family 2 protein [Bacteroidetes bacterium]|uniref:Glycosyltransferase family 2 protein n=1 Tax=Candidatus Cryptobacteroides avicola TaxID=2840757 RepID=A0A940IHQ3_9BACT|nr:glycosyltransferase family 2 protein [Candidatus Cryptobacteroides avicola]
MNTPANSDKDISIVISLYNEVESLTELVGWIRSVMERNGYVYEIIMVDDGSSDGSWDKIISLSRTDRSVRGISFRRNYGKSAALYCGFKAAEGRVVVTMDADLQDSPEEIPEMYRMITEDGYDIVSGWKRHRKDNALTKNIPSKIYNAAARKITGIRLHDMNCGLKAYNSEVVKNIEVYGEMHRFIPYLAKNAGFTKITEKPVHHQKRKYGKSKFGMSRFVNGFLDLLSIWFLCTFGKNPMHFFGLTGILMFLTGGIIAVWLIISKLIHQSNGLDFRPVTDQPLFYLALVAVLVGVQLFLSGFISELVSRNSSERNHYNIKDTI